MVPGGDGRGCRIGSLVVGRAFIRISACEATYQYHTYHATFAAFLSTTGMGKAVKFSTYWFLPKN
eukprot:1816736-Ditylum_brightwellii.AAC.1